MRSSVRARLVDEVSAQLRGRPVLWFGPRGTDVDPLSDLPELQSSASLIARWVESPRPSTSLEDGSRQREDLDAHETDARFEQPEVQMFLDAVADGIKEPAVVLPYRPSEFVKRLCDLRPETTVLSAMATGHSSLDHKPWVETSLAQHGVRTVPWTYLRTAKSYGAKRLFQRGRAVVRPERSSGGAGMVLISDQNELNSILAAHTDRFLCIAPYLEGAVPLNAAGVVWPDGVSLHPGSVQIIGDSAFTARRFGYCGNDFRALREIERPAVKQLQGLTLRVGRWLQSLGFLGAFGVDALLHEEKVYFVELNPRLQGSSKVSAMSSRRSDLPCVLLEHLAALLGLLMPPEKRPLVDQPVPLSQVILHNLTGSEQICARELPANLNDINGGEHSVRAHDLDPHPGARLAPNAALLRVFVDDFVATFNGLVIPKWRDRLAPVAAAMMALQIVPAKISNEGT